MKTESFPALKPARALISVSDKSGLIEFCRGLRRHDIELLSTGGTFSHLRDAGVAVTEVSEYTGFPEMMGGRIKTLHPKIHGGILGRRKTDDAVMNTHGILPIDLVVVNLYPFLETISRPDCTREMAIENIDIGGPAMVRSAAKNYRDVAIVTQASQYELVLAQLDGPSGGLSEQDRFQLSAAAFRHTAEYDAAIATWLANQLPARAPGGEDSETLQPAETEDRFPEQLTLQMERVSVLRYGENPHQSAAFYREPGYADPSIASARQLQGKALSFNNIADADAALECVKTFADPACVIVKHANPCGVAIGTDIGQAYDLAFATDPTSAFGGIIAFNRELDGETAAEILGRQFVEVIIAPALSTRASDVLAGKPNIRVLVCGALDNQRQPALDYRRVTGGLLIQDRDIGIINAHELKLVSTRAPDEQEISDLLFAWDVAKFVKSNAIVYAKAGRTIGIGAGQMSRVYSAQIGVMKATDEGLTVKGSVMASDAFFPFRDGVDAAAKAGVTAIVQPGGSMRDEEVIQAANEHGMAMVFTGMRHFRH